MVEFSGFGCLRHGAGDEIDLLISQNCRKAKFPASGRQVFGSEVLANPPDFASSDEKAKLCPPTLPLITRMFGQGLEEQITQQVTARLSAPPAQVNGSRISREL